MMFQKAKKSKAKLRVALAGPPGSGKTESALRMARGLVGPEGKIAVLDTENDSASLYADRYDFDVAPLHAPYTPESYIKGIKSAEEAGYDLLIIDSATHEWKGSGGVLSIHSSVVQSQKNANSYVAWNTVTPRHQAFVDAIVQSKIHIICTMRSKTAYVQGKKNGKTIIDKVGEAPEQRAGFEYEFTSVLDIRQSDHKAVASKDRSGVFKGQTPILITEQTGQALHEWLNSGEAPEPVEYRPSPAMQAESTKWINNAHKRGKWDEAIQAVDTQFEGDDAAFMKRQLELARETLSVGSLSDEDNNLDFGDDFDPQTGEVYQQEA